MTDILCRWINDELKISQLTDPTIFERNFSTGYLIGEVLSKYQLQNDFDKFTSSRTKDSKLNNFTRLEPTLHLLNIPFDTSVARAIMTETHGVATRFMYQLYIALNNRKKSNLTGVAMETMRPAAPVKLSAVETGIYKDRLKHVTPRQTDLELQEVVQRFHDKQIEMEKIAFKERFLEQERIREQQQKERQFFMERSRTMGLKQSEMVAKLQAATVMIPLPPPQKTIAAMEAKAVRKRRKIAEDTIRCIFNFEEKMKVTQAPSKDDDDEGIGMDYLMSTKDDAKTQLECVDLIKPQSNDDYIGKISKRLQEDAFARAERDKRRRKVMVDQIKAHESQEEAHHEEMLVNRLMRQSQQERRIAVQLLQSRHEKEAIRKNRILQNQMYEERRLKDFDEALDREAELVRLAKLEYEEQTRKDKELHDRIAAERAEAKYSKHYDLCAVVTDQIVDYSCTVAEYRELTSKLVPAKLMREWRAQFEAGILLYEKKVVTEAPEMTAQQVLEEERCNLLDEGDFIEYKNMVGEWQPPESSEISGPPRNNPIVGHVVQRLLNMVYPPSPPPPPPEYPPFPIRACALGKTFAGKTSCLQKIANDHRLQLLNADLLVKEAIEASRDNEMMEVAVGQEMDKAKDSLENMPMDEISAVPAESAPVEARSISRVGADTPAERKRKVTASSQPEPKLQPTLRARLGTKALKFLKKGQTVEDQVIIDILVEVIRRVPENTGWILDGFPSTYNQAKMLEKALSGFNVTAKDSKGKLDKGRQRKSLLASDPRPSPVPAEPASGIDVVILFDVSDELCLKRAAGRTKATLLDEEFYKEFNPLPADSGSGMGQQEKGVPVLDEAHDLEQLQHRITGFLDNWSKLEKWFSKFGSLKKVDASQQQQTVHLEVEKILEDTLNKLQGKDQESSQPLEQTTIAVVKKEEPPAPPSQSQKSTLPEETRSLSRKGSGKKVSPSTSLVKSPKDKDKKQDKSGSPKYTADSKKSDDGSAKNGGDASPKTKQKTLEPEPLPEVPAGPAPPQPWSEEWVFVDQNIEPELAKVLADHWEAVEKTYLQNSKFVFRKIRDERENIYRYFFQMRKDYLAYLRHPDHKQQFVTQFQKEYNDVPDDLRQDEETKMELHQRVDDLRERLWNICDDRKEHAELEREAMKGNGWLDDRLGILSNFYIMLMQTEVDRFQDTVRMLKDYYRGMEGRIPDELNVNYVRLPLVELPMLKQGIPEKQVTEIQKTSTPGSRPGTGKSNRFKSPKSDKAGAHKSPTREKSPKGSKSRSRTPSAKKRDKSKEKDKLAEVQALLTEGGTKIPLLPFRLTSADVDQKTAAAAKDKKKKDDSIESAVPLTDPDEKLIFDAFHRSFISLGSIMATEEAAREATEEAGKQKEHAAAAFAKQKATGNTKRGRSPSPKKVAEKDDDAPLSEFESDEEKAKKSVYNLMKQEYVFALQEEEKAVKARLQIIKATAVSVLHDVHNKGDMAFKDLNDWLGARYLKEMESIDTMSEIVRYAIESRQQIKQELVLQQEDFLLNEDLAVFKVPSPPPPPPPPLPLKNQIEVPTSDMFTVAQIMNLYNQFVTSAPTGVMSSKAFLETFENMVQVAHGTMEQLPDVWLNISQQKIQDIATGASSDSEYVDWRRFILALAQPIPVPKQLELLETLAQFREMDQKSRGFVTREQYDRMNLWFTARDSGGEASNRLTMLKAVLFDVFADHNRTPPALDYMGMLLYFCATSSSQEGFMRALAVATGTHMPRIPKVLTESDSVINSLETPDNLEVVSSLPPYEVIPVEAMEAVVPLDALYRVLHHGETAKGDSHRFSVTAGPEYSTSREKLASVYRELGSEDGQPIPFKVLIEHPQIQDIVRACKTYKSLNLKSILAGSENVDVHSAKMGD